MYITLLLSHGEGKFKTSSANFLNNVSERNVWSESLQGSSVIFKDLSIEDT